jgi:hypothetical protein
MAEQLVNGKLDRIWKEAVMDNSSYFPSIWIVDRRDTTTNPTQDNQCPRRDSNEHFSNKEDASNRYIERVSEIVRFRI